MGFPKGTVLGKHTRDENGRLLNKDGSLFKVVPNRGQAAKGQRRSPETEFKKGTPAHNKGKKLADYVPDYSIKKIMQSNFQKGNVPHTAHPEGTVVRLERYRKNGAKEVVYTINIDWHGNRKPHNTYKWYLWEVEHQQDRPKGMILAIKNSDPDDIRLENLELITRSENMIRNSRY